MAKILREYVDLVYDKSLVKEATDKNQSIILKKCILQRADAPNQNKRIYPRQILQREVENYRKAVTEGRATGECVPAGTEILTESGWIDIKDIKLSDNIYTLNLLTNEIEIQGIDKKIEKKYNDKVVHVKNERGTLDMVITKDHKIPLWDRNDKYYELTALELYEKHAKKDSKLSHSKIKRSGEWNVEQKSDEPFQVPGTDIFVGVNDWASLESISLDHRFVSVDLEDFNDWVYCVSVENKTWLMRHNGAVCWTRNCDHPESSIVSLSNVSHIVREIDWNGDEVVGVVEILNTPKGRIIQELMNAGVKLGISSRGVGDTVKNEGGHDVVDESFQLIAFDLVSEPSTINAWLHESKDINMDKIRKMIPKIDRINRALNDILKRG